MGDEPVFKRATQQRIDCEQHVFLVFGSLFIRSISIFRKTKITHKKALKDRE
jgi:hypothetical protein